MALFGPCANLLSQDYRTASAASICALLPSTLRLAHLRALDLLRCGFQEALPPLCGSPRHHHHQNPKRSLGDQITLGFVQSCELHQSSTVGPCPVWRNSPKLTIRTWSNRLNFTKAHHSDLPILRTSPKLTIRTWPNRLNFTKVHHSGLSNLANFSFVQHPDLVQSCELTKA